MNMSIMAILFAAIMGLCSVMLDGCGLRWSAPAGPYEEDPATVTDDSFSPVIQYTGPAQYAGSPGNVLLNYHLRGFKERKTGALANQLYMHADYADESWIFFNAVTFDGGVDAGFIPIAQEVGSCFHYGCERYEDFAIPLTIQFLHDHAGTGFAVEASSRSGTKVIFQVRPNSVQHYLAVVSGESL